MVKITVFCFHPAFFPPKSGGEEREYYLYYFLSVFHDITLISFTHRSDSSTAEFVQHSKNFQEIRIPKSMISDYLYRAVTIFSQIVECSGIICSIESIFNSRFRKVGIDYIIGADVIIFDQPYLFTFPKRAFSQKKVVLNTYNNELEMVKPTLGKGLLGKIFLAYVRCLEKRAIKNSNLILCVSELDMKSLSTEYHKDIEKFSLVPNGVSLSSYDFIFDHRIPLPHQKTGIFIGSFHPPNISAVKHIITFADFDPDIQFLIIGGVSDYFLKIDGLTEPCSIDPSFLPHFSQVFILEEAYLPEFWGEKPIVWTKPSFIISFCQKTTEMTVSLFSPSTQELLLSSGSFSDSKKLVSGWNKIEIRTDKLDYLQFLCNFPHSDEKRTLGVAICEIACNVSGEWVKKSGNELCSKVRRIKTHPNICFLGTVSEEEKLSLYQNVNFAINPMTEGSGTNIKVFGYLAAGIPVITTPTGARGIPLVNEFNAIISEIDEFPRAISHLLSREDLLAELPLNGRALVEELYDWKVIADQMNKLL